MRIKSGLIIGILAFILLPSFAFSQEQITITTYYPSPYGSYQDLETQRLAVAYPAGSTIFWDNFATVRTAYGDTIAIGGDAAGGDAEIRISAPANRNTVSFWNSTLSTYANIQAANLPGCKRIPYFANSGRRECGDRSVPPDGDCTDSGESCTSYLSFFPATGVGVNYPSFGWYLCCEAS